MELYDTYNLTGNKTLNKSGIEANTTWKEFTSLKIKYTNPKIRLMTK